MTKRENTFGLRPVLQEFASAAQQGALASEVRAQAQRFTARPNVIATMRGEFTTAGLVRCEQALIDAAAGRAGEKTGLLDPAHAKRALTAAERPLTVEQAQVVKRVVESGDGVSVIEALAGTGKTYTAGALREVYEHAGYTVLGAAPIGRATRELAEQADIASRTLDQLLIDIEQLGDELPKRCVLILDEAGMAATRLTARDRPRPLAGAGDRRGHDRRQSDNPRLAPRRAEHAVPDLPRGRSAPAARPVLRARCRRRRGRVRALNADGQADRPAAAARARRGSEHRPAAEPRRDRLDRPRPGSAAADGPAEPQPGGRPVGKGQGRNDSRKPPRTRLLLGDCRQGDVIYGRLPPAWLRLRPWYAHRKLRTLVTGAGTR